jgi:hypothetical protein
MILANGRWCGSQCNMCAISRNSTQLAKALMCFKPSRKYKQWPFRYLRTGQCVTFRPGQPEHPKHEYWPLRSLRMGRIVAYVLAIAL